MANKRPVARRALAAHCPATSVVIVLWIGAQDVLTAKITAGRLGQFIIYAVLAAGALVPGIKAE